MIFVDTGAWIAIYKRNDRHHREAMAIYNSWSLLINKP